MEWKHVITADPRVLHGAVRFANTRIPVTVVLDNLADGATPAEILAQFPSLRPEHILQRWPTQPISRASA